MVQTLVPHLLGLIVAIATLSGMSLAQDLPRENIQADVDVLQLLEAEKLDTITFAQPLYFDAPEGPPTYVPAGNYRVAQEKHASLRLTHRDEESSILIHTQSLSQVDQVSVPVALSVPEPDDTLHLVLLLPGGKGLESIGSFESVRVRGGLRRLISPDRIHQALQEKIASLQQATPKEQPGSVP